MADAIYAILTRSRTTSPLIVKAQSVLYTSVSSNVLTVQSSHEIHAYHMSLLRTAIKEWIEHELCDYPWWIKKSAQPPVEDIQAILCLYYGLSDAIATIQSIFHYSDACMRMLKRGETQSHIVSLAVFAEMCLHTESIQSLFVSSITEGLIKTDNSIFKAQIKCLEQFPPEKKKIEALVLDSIRQHYCAIDTFNKSDCDWIPHATHQLRALATLDQSSFTHAVLQAARETLFGRHFHAVAAMFEQMVTSSTVSTLHPIDANLSALADICAHECDVSQRAVLSAIMDGILAVKLRESHADGRISRATELYQWICQFQDVAHECVDTICSHACYLHVVTAFFTEIGADTAATELAVFAVKSLCLQRGDGDLDRLLTRTVLQFVCVLQSQDVFIETLARQLAKMNVNLWTGRIGRMDLAFRRCQEMAELFRRNLAVPFTKIDDIIKDFSASREPSEALLAAFASITPDFASLHVLTAAESAWGLRTCEFDVVGLPPTLSTLITAYSTAYKQIHSARKLVWLHHLTTCDIRISGRRGLTVSLLQLAVLHCLYLHCDTQEHAAKRARPRLPVSLAVHEIASRTGLSGLLPVIQSLLIADVVAETVGADSTTTYSLNLSARAWKSMRNIATAPRQQETPLSSDSVVRKMQLKCLIIKALKAERKIDSIDLLFVAVCRLNSESRTGSILVTKEQLQKQLAELVESKYADIIPGGGIIYMP